METAIIWAVVWGCLALFGSGFLGWIVGVSLLLIADLFNKVWIAVTGVVLTWVVGVTWFIFATVHCVQNIFTAISLA